MNRYSFDKNIFGKEYLSNHFQEYSFGKNIFGEEVMNCVGVEGTHGGRLADTWTHKTLLRCIDHHYISLHCTTLTALYLIQGIIVHCIALHCSTLYCIRLHPKISCSTVQQCVSHPHNLKSCDRRLVLSYKVKHFLFDHKLQNIKNYKLFQLNYSAK